MSKTYAWNFNIVDGGLLVRRAISQDSIGVLVLNENGYLEFWHQGTMYCQTKSLRRLVQTINRIEKET